MKNKKAKLLSVLCGATLAVSAGALASCSLDSITNLFGKEQEKTYTLDLEGIYKYAVDNGYEGTYYDFINAVKGEMGNGIASVEKTSSDGLVDTYTITYTDGTTSVFTITNGEKGDTGETGEKGEDGEDGKDGEDGHTPVITIGEDGCWAVDGVSTGVKAEGATGETGEKGDTGVGVYTVSVDDQGNLIITLTNEVELNAGNILALIRENTTEHTVTFVYRAPDGTDAVLGTQKVKDGAKVADPLTGSDRDFTFALYDLGQDPATVEGWYYLYKGNLVDWAIYGYTVTEDMTLYCIPKAFTINYNLDETATYYLNGKTYTAEQLEETLPDSYYMGDEGLPLVMAYSRNGDVLSVMEGWETADGGSIDMKNRYGDIAVQPKWKTVEYGYVSDGLMVDTDGKVAAGTVAATVYSGEDTTVIISGDNITALGRYNNINNKLFNGNATVEYLYIIAPNLTTIWQQSAGDAWRPFQNMSALQGAVISSDVLTANTNLSFRNCTALESVAFDCDNMNTLADSTFYGCSVLQSVVLPAACKTISGSAFCNAADFDYEANFGWDVINSWTSVGANAFYGLNTVKEVIIDEEHFSGLETLNNMFGANVNLERVEIHTDATSYSLSFGGLSKLSSAEVYAPNATSFTGSFSSDAALKNLYIYAPGMTGTFSSILTGTGIESLIVTDNAEYEGDEQAVVVVGSGFAATGTLAYGMTALTEATIDVASLETISPSMFYNDGALKTVTVNKGDIKVIGTSAFYHCSALETIVLPAVAEGTYYASNYNTYSGYSYTGIDYIFENCTSLKSISNLEAFEKLFENMTGVVNYGGGKFPYDAPIFAPDAETGIAVVGTILISGAETTGEVVIPADITVIAANAFNGADITSVSFAEGSQIKSIGKSAFGNCAKLVSVDMSNATLLETMKEGYTFQGDTALKSVILSKSESFTALPDYIFGSTTDRVGLESLVIPSNIKTIGASAFANSYITSVTFEEGTAITSVGNNAFQATVMNGEQASKLLQDLAVALQAGSTDGSVVLPARLFYRNDANVTDRIDNLTTITIPAIYTSIGEFAFHGCINLTEVNFEGYDAETNVSTSNLASIGNNAFMNTALTSFVFQPKMTATYSFNGFSAFTSAKFAVDTEGNSAMQTITASTFRDTGITSIELPAGITNIMGSAFYNTKITSIALPAGLAYVSTTYPGLGSSAFYGCTELTSVTVQGDESGVNKLPEGITNVLASMFYNCSSLKSMVLPAGVTTLGASVFYGCSSLTSVTVQGDESGVNTVPSGVTAILASTFQKCTSLKSFVIPVTVTTNLAANAFNGCTSLETLTVPGCLGYAAATCFTGCTALKEVYIVKGRSIYISNGGSATSGTAYTSSTYNRTPWYVVNSNVASDDIEKGYVVIGEGITNVIAYSFYNEANLSIYVEGASIATKGGNNGNLTSGTNVYYGLNTTWEYVDGVPTVKVTE